MCIGLAGGVVVLCLNLNLFRHLIRNFDLSLAVVVVVFGVACSCGFKCWCVWSKRGGLCVTCIQFTLRYWCDCGCCDRRCPRGLLGRRECGRSGV